MKNRRPPFPVSIAIALAGALVACGGPPGKAEIVLCIGSRVTVRGNDSVLAVTASSRTTRSYAVDGFDFTADLIPRWQRWNGNLGIYLPAGRGDTYTVLEEGQQFFSSEEELYQWIDWAGQWGGELRYTSDGLLVRWEIGERDRDGEAPKRSLYVDIAQLMLNGERPAGLPGADDAAFTIENPANGCEVGQAMHSQFVASRPARLGGREYAGWALDVIRAHGLTPEDVEHTISHGRARRFEDITIYSYEPPDGDWRRMFRVNVDTHGKVIRVFY